MISYQKVCETNGDYKPPFLVNCDVDRGCQASAECLETACAVETMKLYSRSPFFIAKKCLIPRAALSLFLSTILWSYNCQPKLCNVYLRYYGSCERRVEPNQRPILWNGTRPVKDPGYNNIGAKNSQSWQL